MIFNGNSSQFLPVKYFCKKHDSQSLVKLYIKVPQLTLRWRKRNFLNLLICLASVTITVIIISLFKVDRIVKYW